jgi:hypothetical protein
VLRPAQKEDAPLKALYALVLALPALAAHAQTLDVSPSAAYDLDDCFWEITEQGTMPVPMIASESTVKTLDEADDVATTGRDDAEGIPVGAIPPSDEIQTMPAHMNASEPTIEKLDEAEDVAITGRNDAEDIPVGAIRLDDETQTMRDQGLASEPTIEWLGEADEADGMDERAVPSGF